MRILILYTKNRREIFNRKSAIGSYIFCLSQLLQSKKNKIFLNGELFSQIKQREDKNSPHSISKKNIIKKLIPNKLKNIFREKRKLIEIEKFKSQLLNDNNKYDAILEFYNLGSDVGYNLSKQLNIPLYITYDGPIFEEYEFFNKSKPYLYNLLKEREDLSLKQAEKIVVYSNPMKEFVYNLTRKKENIFIHQNVDFSRFDILNDDKEFETEELNICFIGSFLKWHQVDLLVKCFENIIKKGIQAKLFLIGDGQERERIQSQVNFLTEDIKSKIKFTGFIDGKELYELKKQMHIGVMPGSNWYGAPNKIFEYGAMKMAVVAPDTPTIKDLFTNKEVKIFKWKNQESLNQALLDLCFDKNKMIKYSKVLNDKITNEYSVENTLDFYKELFNINSISKC